jgi:hypothetical protein
MILLSDCQCRQCRDYRWLVARVKEFQAERGPVEFDWEDLAKTASGPVAAARSMNGEVK